MCSTSITLNLTQITMMICIMDGLARATYVEYIDNNGDGKCDVVLSWSYTYCVVLHQKI